MRKLTINFLLTIALGFAATMSSADHVIDESDGPSFLYVLSAKSGSLEDNVLTLKDIPLVVYFSNRPDRIAGHESLKKFANHWQEGSDSFEADPPNAVLSVFNESGNNDVVIELKDFQIQGDTMTSNVRILNGNLSGSFGASSLFVDPVVNPQITD